MPLYLGTLRSEVSFFHNMLTHDPIGRNDPLAKGVDRTLYHRLKGAEPPAPPGVPNPNDAANAARQQTDALRMRRGMLANIFAGTGGGAAQVGRTQLGGG